MRVAVLYTYPAYSRVDSADEASLNTWDENTDLIHRSYPGHTLIGMLELQKTNENGDISFMEILLCESSETTPHAYHISIIAWLAGLS